jgi:hypothetical protein
MALFSFELGAGEVSPCYHPSSGNGAMPIPESAAEHTTEAVAPARVGHVPAQLTLRLGVDSASNRSEQRHALLAGDESTSCTARESPAPCDKGPGPCAEVFLSG